jgi:hypothetical protein
MLGIKPRIVVLRSLVTASEAVAYSVDLYRFYAGPRRATAGLLAAWSEACYICLQFKGFC